MCAQEKKKDRNKCSYKGFNNGYVTELIKIRFYLVPKKLTLSYIDANLSYMSKCLSWDLSGLEKPAEALDLDVFHLLSAQSLLNKYFLNKLIMEVDFS